MSLAEMLRAKAPMEVDKTENKPEGKRQSEEGQAGSPNKRRTGGKPSPSQAKGRGRGKARSVTLNQGDQNDDALLKAMSALALRHEDSINTLQADLSFISYLETPGQTVASALPALVEVKEAHQQSADTRPLRQRLFTAFMDHFAKEVQKAIANADLIQAGVKDGLMKLEGSSQVSFLYQKWDSAANKLVMDTDAEPLHTKDLLVIIREVTAQSESAGVISRFHLSRAITKDMSGGPVRAHIQLSQLSEPALRSQLNRLIGCTAWTLIGANFRKADVRRSPLAEQVAKLSRKEASSSSNPH